MNLILWNLEQLSKGDQFTVRRRRNRKNTNLEQAHRYLCLLEDLILAPKKKPTSNRNGFPQTDFINLTLNKKQAGEFEDWRNGDATKLATQLAEFIADGNKTSITYDFDNECFIVSSTCKAEGHANENKCLTSRSDDWYEALLMNVYKSNVVFAGAEWVSEDNGRKWG